MTLNERLREMLSKEYGITTDLELLKAIQKQKNIDISVFVDPVKRKEEDRTA